MTGSLITMPQFGETVTEATVLQWLCKVGDTVTAFAPVLEIATDKVDTEVPAPVTGRVTELLVAEGDTVPVGTPLARIDTVWAVEEDRPSADTPDSSTTVVWRHTESPRKRRSTAPMELSPRRHQLSPRQRRMAAVEAAERPAAVELTGVTETSEPQAVSATPLPVRDDSRVVETMTAAPLSAPTLPRFAVAELDVTPLSRTPIDTTLLTAAVAASIFTSVHRRRLTDGDAVELAVDGQHIPRARDLTPAAIRERIAAGKGAAPTGDAAWIGVEDVGKLGLSTVTGPLDEGYRLHVCVGATVERAVVTTAASGRPVIEFISAATVSVAADPSITTAQIGQLIDDIRTRISDPRWVAELCES